METIINSPTQAIHDASDDAEDLYDDFWHVLNRNKRLLNQLYDTNSSFSGGRRKKNRRTRRKSRKGRKGGKSRKH